MEIFLMRNLIIFMKHKHLDGEIFKIMNSQKE
nr:MAG TPA: hypothetical protein [Bacteriophage sp.]